MKHLLYQSFFLFLVTLWKLIILKTLWICECVLQLAPSFSLRRCDSRKKVMAATLVMGHMRTLFSSVLYCAGCSINHCQTRKQLPVWANTLTLWGCLVLVKQWNITAHTYFASSQMQIMGTWHKINLSGSHCRFMKKSHGTVVYHEFRWFLCLEAN